MPIMQFMCLACKHYQGEKDTGGFPIEVCAAFPEGIPDEILDGYDHRRPFGTESILFELAPGEQDTLDNYDFRVQQMREWELRQKQ